MPRQRRRLRPSSLLLPDYFKPPEELADANATYRDAIATRRKVTEAVPAARTKLREAKGRDEPPAAVRKLEHAVADAEHRYREAKRAEDRALHVLARAIHANREILFTQVDADELAASALAKLDEAAQELDVLAEEVGALRTLATVEQPRTVARGFEPVHSPADRHNTPLAHLAALRGWVGELRELADRLTRPEATGEEERAA